MRVRRITTNLPVADIDAAKSFYTDFLGLSTEEFNLGWVARFTSPTTGEHVPCPPNTQHSSYERPTLVAWLPRSPSAPKPMTSASSNASDTTARTRQMSFAAPSGCSIVKNGYN